MGPDLEPIIPTIIQSATISADELAASMERIYPAHSIRVNMDGYIYPDDIRSTPSYHICSEDKCAMFNDPEKCKLYNKMIRYLDKEQKQNNVEEKPKASILTKIFRKDILC